MHTHIETYKQSIKQTTYKSIVRTYLPHGRGFHLHHHLYQDDQEYHPHHHHHPNDLEYHLHLNPLKLKNVRVVE